MRALTGGSAVLGFVVVLLAWDVSKRFIAVPPLPRAAPFEIGAAKPPATTPRAPSSFTRPDFQGVVIDGGALDPKPVQAPQAISRTSPDLRQPAPGANGSADGPALPARQFPPGSKAHVEAIATAIDSEESRSMVAPIARLYFAFFDRAADYEGLNHYIGERDAGTSLESIAAEFAGSEEFRIRYGGLDNAAFVDRVFRNVFDAPPDSAQRAQWIAQLDGGMSRGQLMIAFSESNAFRVASSNEVFVSMAFAEALRRAPEPDEFSRWVRFLDAGKPREELIAGLVTSRTPARR